MKTKFFLSIFLFCALIGAAAAQTAASVKIGYTDPEYILQNMTEYKQIESELKSYEKQLQTQLDNKLKDYQTKLQAYQDEYNKGNMPDIIKEDKEKELISMQTTIKQFEESAMTSMQKKQATLLDPLIQKVQKAIDEVAAENGYTYILSTSAGPSAAIILYAKNKDEDISELVLKKLGVTLPKTDTTNNTGIINNNNNNTNTNTNTNNTNNTTAPLKKKP